MNIFKREMKFNLKAFLIWSIIVSLFYFLIVTIYPSIISSQDLSALMKMFPEEILKVFNMDLMNISTATGWIATEGIIFFILIGSLYSCSLGLNLILKEENDKTIEFLYSKPVTKNKIVTNKVLCGFLYITMFTLINILFVVLALLIINDLNFKLTINLFIAPLMIFYCLYAISLLISTFLRKSKKSIGISFGLVFGFYLIQIVSGLSNKVSFLKYFTVFTLSDSRYIIQKGSLNIWCCLISFVIVATSLFFTYFNYNKKEYLV